MDEARRQHQRLHQRCPEGVVLAGRRGATARPIGALLKTLATETELFEVLRRPRIARALTPLHAASLHRILDAAEFVTISEHVSFCRDLKDDKFMELAVNGNADLIVSGDADLVMLDRFRDIPIITPAQFGHFLAVR